MPRYYLLQAGIDPERDFKSVAFSGAHDATVAFVAAGRAEAGVLNASVMDKLVESKNPNAEKVRVLAITPPYFDYNWTVRPGLDPALTKKITDAFLKLDPANPAMKEIMDLQRASKFIADPELELRRHRGGRALGRVDQVASPMNGLRLEGAGLVHPNGQRALKNVSLALGARRARRRDRPVGRGQDDAGARPRHVAQAERRTRVRSTTTILGGSAPARCAGVRARDRRRPPEPADSAAPARRHRRPRRPPRHLADLEGARLAARSRRRRRRARRARPARPRRPGLRSLRPALGRPAAARRHRPRAVPAAGVHPRRRAGVGARPALAD